MAKTIKFNLICDNNPVRTLEDLQENFVIQDILSYYNNKLLHRWLEVRGYKEELEEVSGIQEKKPLDIIKELIRIFKITKDEKEVEQDVYMLEYLEERKELSAIYEEQQYKVKEIIDDYQSGYRQLVDGILENPSDVAKIKASINEMVSNYLWILQLDHRNLFYLLREKSYLTIMCLLMNEKARKFYLPVEKKNEDGTVTSDTATNNDKLIMFQNICQMIKTSGFKEQLGENIISFAGITDGYWKDLEPKGKKYMIISMESSDYVRSAGEAGGDLSSTDINGKFVIVDGIDYKSNSATHQLLYMEV